MSKCHFLIFVNQVSDQKYCFWFSISWFLKKSVKISIFSKKGLYSVEFNPSNILRDYNSSTGNITLLENNPKNFRVILQLRVKFPFLNFLGLNSKSVIFPCVNICQLASFGLFKGFWHLTEFSTWRDASTSHFLPSARAFDGMSSWQDIWTLGIVAKREILLTGPRLQLWRSRAKIKVNAAEKKLNCIKHNLC